MTIELKEVSREEGAARVEALREHPLFSLFHSPPWLQVLERFYGLQPRYFEVWKDGRAAGVLPALEARKGPLRILASPLTGTNTAYMGPLVDPEILPAVCEAFVRHAARCKADYVELSLPLDWSGSTGERGALRCAPRESYMLPLSPRESELWAALTSKCRNMVRKAQKSGVRVVEGTRQELRLFYQMLQEVFSKHRQAPPQSVEFFQVLWDVLGPRRQLRLLLAEHEGRRLAGAVFVWDHRTAYYLSGASFSEANRLAANNLIQWEFIRSAGASGLVRYDLYGKRIPAIDRFKESFGATRFTYGYVWKCLNWRAAAGRAVYQLAVPLLRRTRYLLRPAAAALRDSGCDKDEAIPDRRGCERHEEEHGGTVFTGSERWDGQWRHC